MSNTTNNTNEHTQRIQGQIRGLAKQLTKLAPHPDMGHAGAALISLNSAFKPAAEYEGMMGSLLVDGFLGEAFSGAASNDNSITGALCAIDFNLIEAADQYLEDTDKTHNNHGRGRGSIALYERAPLRKAFNDPRDAAFSAYHADFQQRANIEQHIAALVSELDSYQYTPSFEPEALCA